MTEYRYEIHMHTSAVSKCGHDTPEEMIRETIAKGYSGAVLTEHINGATFSDMQGAGWQTKMDHYLTGFRRASAAAEGSDFTVFLGTEFNFTENWNDYLVYGLNEDILRYELDDSVRDWGIKRFSEFCRANGLLLIQAHPFRKDMTIVRPEFLDGIEVLNAHPRHESRNFLARAHAEYHDLLMTGGSDAHAVGDVGRGGIVTDHKLTGISDVVSELRAGARIIVPEEQKKYFDGKGVFDTRRQA